MILVLSNVTMKPSNVRKQIRESSNVTKVQSHVMLLPHNVRMVPSNVRKNKGITKYDKSAVSCDVGIAQYEDSTIKCDKQIREL